MDVLSRTKTDEAQQIGQILSDSSLPGSRSPSSAPSPEAAHENVSLWADISGVKLRSNDYYRFTPNVAGKYMLMAKWRQEVQGVSNFQIRIEKNEQGTSSYTYPNVIFQNDRPFNYDQTYTGGILEANGSTDNFRVRVYSASGRDISASFGTYFAGYKLIGA